MKKIRNDEKRKKKIRNEKTVALKKAIAGAVACALVFAAGCGGGNIPSSQSESERLSDVSRSENPGNNDSESSDSDPSIAGKALRIVESLMKRPQPWDFLPSAFRPQNMAYTVLPVGDFSNDTAVSEIGKKFIGKQMNVLYEGLIQAQTVLGYLDAVYAIGGTVAQAYQLFINDNPTAHEVFTGNAGGFSVKVELDGEKAVLLAGNATVSVELSTDGETGKNACRIQATDGVAIKCVYDDDHLKTAVSANVNGAGILKQIEFVREEGAIAGYLYEYVGTADKNIRTSALIFSDEARTAIVSDKRETDDLLIDGSEEVYDSRTGEYIGGEIAETVKAADYDTYWLNLYDVPGFVKARVVNEANSFNADTIYINGGNSPFAVKRVGGIGLKMASRRFDVEMKEVRYVVADGKGGTQLAKTEIPMLFVQKENAADFTADVTEVNPSLFSVQPLLSEDILDAVGGDFQVMLASFSLIKENVSYEYIRSFIGEKDGFFVAAEGE